ncbi:OsmC family peroxiredoxin [Hymenobacter humi]|uniref:OsmC family peroxiredoxin n=1 Tax=Hymenobacter humi TaxID=1411620 RepID=A0ABW2U344_9BACT
MADHKGTAAWTGDIKGSGTLTTESGLLNAPYSVGSRFEGKPGTNPEELIGAAHAGCYTMYLAGALTRHGHQVQSINTTSTVTMNPNNGNPVIEHIHISTEGHVSGGNITSEDFQKHAEDAKANCPVSKLLAAVPKMTLEAKFVG